MPTEAEIQAQIEQQPAKVTFTPEQQAKVDELIRAAQGRAAATERAQVVELTNRLTTLEQDLAAAKAEKSTAKTKTEKADADANIEAVKAEMREASMLIQRERDLAVKAAEAAKREALTFKQQAEDTRKQQVISGAVAKAGFIDPEIVTAITKDQVAWDENLGRYVVKGEKGEPKYNSAYEPMTLEEFYHELAVNKPYLVRGEVKPGASSTANGRFDAGNMTNVPLEKLFGPKSEAKLANALALKDIKEYRRLKEVAKASGLLK